MSNLFGRDKTTERPNLPNTNTNNARQVTQTPPAEQPTTLPQTQAPVSAKQFDSMPEQVKTEPKAETKAPVGLLGETGKKSTGRQSNPNFLSVDQFTKQLKEKHGYVLSHDYVVRCIKAEVIKNSTVPSLLPTEGARRAAKYNIPVGEVDRIAGEMKKLETQTGGATK